MPITHLTSTPAGKTGKGTSTGSTKETPHSTAPAPFPESVTPMTPV